MGVSDKSKYELDYSNYDFGQFTITIPQKPNWIEDETYLELYREYENKMANARSAVDLYFNEALNNRNLLINASASIDAIIKEYNNLLEKLTKCSTIIYTSARNISSANKYINWAYDNKKNSSTKISKIKKNVENQKEKIVNLHSNIKNLKEDINTRIKNLENCKKKNQDFENRFISVLRYLNGMGIKLGLPSKFE